MQKRTVQRILVMVAIIWSSSLIISIGPIFGWKDDAYEKRIQEKQCLISQDILYQICGTIAAFYAPLAFIMILYWKIYSTARQRIKAQRQRRVANSRGLVNQHKTHAYKAVGMEENRSWYEQVSDTKKPYMSVESASSSHELDSINDSILALNYCGKNSSGSPLVKVSATAGAINDGAAAMITPVVNGGNSNIVASTAADALFIQNQRAAPITAPQTQKPTPVRSASFFVRAGRSLRFTMKSNTKNGFIEREKRKLSKLVDTRLHLKKATKRQLLCVYISD
uniref:G-protein coupled receptors family 1 profile domain-containing protein n=1 Tax=Romanomermis culicivorax TaxID=13658 RepID=A0A915IR62_ROMCU